MLGDTELLISDQSINHADDIRMYGNKCLNIIVVILKRHFKQQIKFLTTLYTSFKSGYKRQPTLHVGVRPAWLETGRKRLYLSLLVWF